MLSLTLAHSGCKPTGRYWLDPTNDKLLREIFRFVRAASIIVEYEHNNGVKVLSGQFVKRSPKPYLTRSRRGYDEGPACCRKTDVRADRMAPIMR